MSQTQYQRFVEIDGSPATGLSVFLSDETATWGVKNNANDAAVVADGTAMTELGGGWYSHTWEDPAFDLSYTVYTEYEFASETTRFAEVVAGTTSAVGAATPERFWDSIIQYEDRSLYTTSRWRLKGIVTKENSQNTDGGLLWASFTRSVDTVTVNVYKDDGLAAGNLVATGSADVSGTDNTGENSAEVTLTESNSSGITGKLWIHEYLADGSNALQVALCTDEDMDALWDAVESLTIYDSTAGLAEPIRVASLFVMSQVTAIFRAELGGYGAAEAWYITDATRVLPDLRRIANAEQLRHATALRALMTAIGRDHERASDTAYSVQRDYFQEQYDAAMSSLVLAIKPGDSGDAFTSATSTAVRLNRV